MSRRLPLVFGVLSLVHLGIGAAACWADDIPLPSSLEIRPHWPEVFPPRHDFFAEKYPVGGLQGMHGRAGGYLDGASVTLHEGGGLATFGGYVHGVRQGTFRVWDEDHKIVLYTQYKDGKKDGVTCLLQDGSPTLVQEWKAGELQRESSEDASAHEKLAEVEAELKEGEQGVRKSLYDWFVEADKQRKAQNVKALNPAAHAARVAGSQRTRQENADGVAGAHPNPYSRIGGAAKAIAKDAAANSKAAAKAAKALAKAGKKALQRRDAELMVESRETYEFAMKALERTGQGMVGNQDQGDPDPKGQPKAKPKRKVKKGKQG